MGEVLKIRRMFFLGGRKNTLTQPRPPENWIRDLGPLKDLSGSFSISLGKASEDVGLSHAENLGLISYTVQQREKTSQVRQGSKDPKATCPEAHS